MVESAAPPLKRESDALLSPVNSIRLLDCLLIGSLSRRWLAAWCLLPLGLPGNAVAHPLNWTKLTLSQRDSVVTAKLEVDLARFVDGYHEYYRLIDESDPQGKIAGAVKQAMADIDVREGDRPLSWVLEELIPPSREDDFFSSMPTPMTFARLRASKQGDSPLRASVAPSNRLELPVVLRTPNGESPLLLTAGTQTDIPVVSKPNTESGQKSPVKSVTPIITAYLKQGFLHVVPAGLDHVLFVLGLFLAGQNLGVLFKQVSAFTAAHTLTLGAAAAGLLQIPSAYVEPLIALSIFWLAFENLWTEKSTRLRYFLIFGFGLVHGLGFAGALREIGLPRESFFASLLSFNAGVELGQITVIASAFALVGWWKNSPRYRIALVQPACAAIALVAAWMTVDRLCL